MPEHVSERRRSLGYLPMWNSFPVSSAAAQAFADIAFTKFTLANLGRTNRKVCLGNELSLVDVLFSDVS